MYIRVFLYPPRAIWKDFPSSDLSHPFLAYTLKLSVWDSTWVLRLPSKFGSPTCFTIRLPNRRKYDLERVCTLPLQEGISHPLTSRMMLEPIPFKEWVLNFPPWEEDSSSPILRRRIAAYYFNFILLLSEAVGVLQAMWKKSCNAGQALSGKTVWGVTNDGQTVVRGNGGAGSITFRGLGITARPNGPHEQRISFR
ncbi:hypothetical protein CEXT_544871 [Caerostris extrusa]|uniref:Uncharacterized protein n=1 Tax=Caerostris extrusa TaxID=172846 RepID=A0AAV4R4U0_CAEEX|nr:hypothetical protein CEXT_544871 [Caerostris extrusa]